MRTNIRQDLDALVRRVEFLETQLEVEVAARTKLTTSVLYRIRVIRAMVVRQETCEATERYHVGQEYTRGSKIVVPAKPRSLKARLFIDRLRRKDVSTIRVLKALEQVEGLTDDSSNGIPRTV